ncbi:glycosyl transferase family 2 [Paenibacillus durus ATCC 35681]|uniref:Glycosyl transferase family 2 n=2 Tax=Paenibacillus durus TaxID=44251 RepID=A0A0F7FFL8_PAEDU|nr:glycosyl transferase family 2 [Paenibacillus durus ATCC 35681]
MIARNEEAVLSRCLESARNLVDEIILVDTGSTDDTKQIAHSFGAKVYDWTWNQNFSDARNAALEHSSCDWNLVLDADEYINNDCEDALRQFIHQGDRIGKIKLVNQFLDNGNILSYAQCFISRLFPSGLRYEGRIHEQIISDLPRATIPVEVQHDGYMKPKSDRNIPILELEIQKHPNDSYYHYQIAKEYRGIDDHLQAYHHLKKAYALLTKQESYSPNVIVNLLYEIIAIDRLEEGLPIVRKEQRFLHDFADFQFVCGIFYMKLILGNTAKYIDLFPLIEESYLKCLQIGETDRYDNVIGTGSFTALHNLGSFYEVTGKLDKAKHCYQEAAALGYEPSRMRLQQLRL